jgi:hypothetical protein
MIKLILLVISIALAVNWLASSRRERAFERVLRHVPAEERSLARLQLVAIESTFNREQSHPEVLTLRQSRVEKFLADFRGSPELEGALFTFVGEH